MPRRGQHQMAGEQLIFNAQKFHIDDPNDLRMYHMVMRKYAGSNILCTEKYFNKSSELFVYVEWLGEKDFIEEFVNPSKIREAATKNPEATAKNIKGIAKKFLHAADLKENAPTPE